MGSVVRVHVSGFFITRRVDALQQSISDDAFRLQKAKWIFAYFLSNQFSKYVAKGVSRGAMSEILIIVNHDLWRYLTVPVSNKIDVFQVAYQRNPACRVKTYLECHSFSLPIISIGTC